MGTKRRGVAGVVAAVVIVTTIFGVRMCARFVGESGEKESSEISAIVSDRAFMADSLNNDTVIKIKKAHKPKARKKNTMRLRSPLDEPVPSE